MAVPIIVRCPCGASTEANAGDVVTCRCGRRYDTTAVDADQVAAAALVQRRHKIYARLGICVAGLATIGGYFVAGYWGAGMALPLSCLVWWKGVQPRWQRRAAADLATIPTSRIEAGS
jgi:hypothetical protein